MLQWNASIMDHLYVSDVMLMEHAHAEPKSVGAQSLLGPDVRVLAGEVHASVIGPNKINL
jgi:predicted nucleotidyltransferase